MASVSDLAKVSPLPLIDLREVSLPHDGFFISLPDVCERHFNKEDLCRAHYATLGLKGAASPGEAIQCPYGFASVPFKEEGESFAITGFVPFPRIGGERERLNSKRFANKKFDVDVVRKIGAALVDVSIAIKAIEEDTVQRHSAALHEIRKLNAKVKQNAERLYRDVDSLATNDSRTRTLTILRASEMMSQQFDIMEILASQNLETDLRLNAISELDRLFYKCMKVYQDPEQPERIKISTASNYHPKIRACDKTIPIIPTVLIQNAEKYSSPKSTIQITIEPRGDLCSVTVSNLAEGQQILDDSIFKSGVRLSEDTDGSGNGLFVAQLVAKQHGTRIDVKTEVLNHLMVRHHFTITFATVKDGSDTT